MHQIFFFFLDYWVCAVSYRAACCLKAMRRDPFKDSNNATIMALLSAHNIQRKMQLFVLSCTDVSEGEINGSFRFYPPAV